MSKIRTSPAFEHSQLDSTICLKSRKKLKHFMLKSGIWTSPDFGKLLYCYRNVQNLDFLTFWCFDCNLFNTQHFLLHLKRPRLVAQYWGCRLIGQIRLCLQWRVKARAKAKYLWLGGRFSPHQTFRDWKINQRQVWGGKISCEVIKLCKCGQSGDAQSSPREKKRKFFLSRHARRWSWDLWEGVDKAESCERRWRFWKAGKC